MIHEVFVIQFQYQSDGYVCNVAGARARFSSVNAVRTGTVGAIGSFRAVHLDGGFLQAPRSASNCLSATAHTLPEAVEDRHSLFPGYTRICSMVSE